MRAALAKKLADLPIPDHLKSPANFDKGGFKFGFCAIYNTRREKAVYRVLCRIPGREPIVLNQIDWNAVTQNCWRFKPKNDTVVPYGDLTTAPENTPIVYQIQKMSFDT